MSTRISAGVDDYPCFTTFYCLLILKSQIFRYTCLFSFFGNNYNIVELTSATSKKE